MVVRNPAHCVRRVEGMRAGDGHRLGGLRNSGGSLARSWIDFSAVSGFGKHGATTNTPGCMRAEGGVGAAAIMFNW